MTTRKILVIDDEPEVCELTKLLLEHAGHYAVGVTESRQASRLLEQETFDAVITDMLMPDKDGLEIMAELRRKHPAVRIIASSGGGRVSSDSYLRIALHSGAHALLSKPFTHEELLACVEAAFQNAPAAKPAA